MWGEHRRWEREDVLCVGGFKGEHNKIHLSAWKNSGKTLKKERSVKKNQLRRLLQGKRRGQVAEATVRAGDELCCGFERPPQQLHEGISVHRICALL